MQHPRTAITTVFDGSTSYECAMVLWCASAARLTRSIPRSEIVIVGKQSSDCPLARYVWSAQVRATRAAAADYLGRIAVSDSWSYIKRGALLKVAVFSLVEYDLLLFADMDVDLWPQGVGRQMGLKQTDRPPGPFDFSRQEWVNSAAAFMKSRALFVGSSDHDSPVNTGVWLLKPRAWLFQALLHALLTTTWDAESGFDHVGTPRIIANSTSLRSRLMAGHVKRGARRGLKKTELHLKATAFWKQNTWRFVAGDIDQGLLFYVIYLQCGVGTWAAHSSLNWRLDHYWGPDKPWTSPPGHAYARQHYLVRVREEFPRLGAADDVDWPAEWHLSSLEDRTRCRGLLGAAWEYLRRRKIEEKDDAPGWSPVRSRVLPDPSVANSFTPRLSEEAGSRQFAIPPASEGGLAAAAVKWRRRRDAWHGL